MNVSKPINTLALCAVMALTLCGCSGGPASPDASAPDAAASASETSSEPSNQASASWVGGDQTTGLDWPADWPARFPRVGGEIIAANSDSEGASYSVVMYVEPGVTVELIESLKGQGLAVLSDDSSGTAQMVALSDDEWRVDVIGVLQQDTDRPHLRYLLQKP